MSYSFFLLAGLLAAGLQPDSYESVTDSLHAVTITADRGVVVSRTDTLSVENSFTITDVLLHSPGIHVGDNGGYAGLKTASLRGLGSAHTAIYIDGVRVGNVQSGQNDLGMTDLENYSSAIVDYAQNSISFKTARPHFGTSPVVGTVRFSAGSFGTYLPSARMDFRLSERISLSANASGIFSRGNFRHADNQTRSNNDVAQIRAGADLFGIIPGGEYHVKAYYNRSERGTPGPVSYPSDDRQKDMNSFLQGVLKKTFSQLYTLHVSAKGSFDDIFYSSIWGDSMYGQTEFQLNTAHDFQIKEWWKLTFAADAMFDGLKSDMYEASRMTAISAVASSFRTDRLMANVALEYEGAFDVDGLSRNAFSPSADLRFTAFKGLDLVAFGRRAYRIPTFNELYYVGYGNPELRAEDAWLTDIGIDFHRTCPSGWAFVTKADAFLNLLKNKITSAPTMEDPAIWAPYNIGKVRSAGVDLLVGMSYESGFLKASADARYAYQSAVDKTPDSYTFGQQIPYIARHTMIVSSSLEWRGWRLDPVWQLRSGRSDGAGELPDYNTLDLNFSKSMNLHRMGQLMFRLSVKNILDSRYDTVSGYPMPGRNIIGGIEYKF